MNIVFDVDGTICFNGQYIEDELSNQIAALQNEHNIIFASARPIRDLIPVVKNFNSQLLIGGNGSIVQKEGKIEVVQSIDAASFKILQDLMQQYHLKYIVDDEFNYASNLSSDYKIYKQLDPDHLAKNIELENISTPIKIILVDIPSNNYPLLKKHIEKLSDHLFINFHDNERNIDITGKNINKYTTLIKYLRNEDYIAFGNDVNDIQLLNHAIKAYFVGTKDNQIALNLQHLNLIEADSQLITQNIGKLLLNWPSMEWWSFYWSSKVSAFYWNSPIENGIKWNFFRKILEIAVTTDALVMNAHKIFRKMGQIGIISSCAIW